MSKKLPLVKITVEFPVINDAHKVSLYRSGKQRVFDWSYNGKARGEITPTALVKRLMKWIGDYDHITAGVNYK